ncbi:3023_t:CDS:2 [Acaulospora morrowiae]|uniref:3023_t:CDS:1 n=1 Tax=Acaulospora morrowiae TaxID=94023 RepID=A0A9N9D1G3_9GLOM|nr:3023_t:CDS:2 [Acaulospora morrowiae]
MSGKSTPKFSKKTKAKRSGQCKNAVKTKIVIRRLPPLLPESLFLDSVKQWANEETTDYYRFHQGRISKSKNKESVFSRAYFHFKTVEQVLEFHRAYDNHLFIDKNGMENRAVVEFAVYQKLPKEHKKPDPRQGTIESDPSYLAFLDSLKAEESQQASSKEPGAALEGGATQLERLETRLALAAASSASNAVEKPTSTPLLDHLRAQKLIAKSKSPPPKQSQLSILSPPGSPAKGSGPKSKQIRGAQNSEVASPSSSPNKPTRRERERKRREREKEKKEKEKIKNKEGKPTDVDTNRGEEGVEENEQERNKEPSDQNKDRESYRERMREKKREKERQRMKEKDKQKSSSETAKGETPIITILTKSQTPEDAKLDAKEKEAKRNAPFKISIQQRQKDQIRQIIQRPTSSSIKKEVDPTDKPAETPVRESTVTPSENSPETASTSTIAPKEHTHNRRRERDRNRRQSASAKQPVQIQILTKPQSKDISTEDNAKTPNESPSVALTPDPEATGQSNNPNTQSSPVAGNMPPPSRKNGRGYFSKRGRW